MYPKATKVEKGYLSQAATAVSQAVTAVRWLFVMQDDDDKVERFTPFAADEMMNQCLLFYLEPFKDLLLHKVAYPDNFRIDHFVEQVKSSMQQHKETTIVQHPDTPYTARVKRIEQVSNTC